MLGAAGAIGGGLLGGTLSHVSDALSMPRRALWRALFGTERGSELVGDLTGMDPEGFGADALGFAAETLLDPITIAGGLAGGPLAKLAYSPWAKDAQLLGLAGDMRAGVGGADAALAARAALEAETIANEVAAAGRLNQLDVPGIAAGKTIAFPNSAPGAVEHAMARGVGFPMDVPLDPMLHYRRPIGFHGRDIPAAAGFEANTVPLNKPWGGLKDGSGPALNPAADPSLLPRPLTDFDRQFLQNFGGQTLGDPLLMSDLERRAAVEALGRQVGANVNAARPMPTLAEAAQQNPLLGELLGGRMESLPGQLPLPAARASMMDEATRLNQLLQSRYMNPSDYAMIAGAGGLGLGVGAYQGGR